MEVSNLFPTGSPQLENYLTKHKVGAKLTADNGTETGWFIIDVGTNPNFPPHPQTGEAVTQVILTVEKEAGPKSG